jgi:hypothetical protein
MKVYQEKQGIVNTGLSQVLVGTDSFSLES